MQKCQDTAVVLQLKIKFCQLLQRSSLNDEIARKKIVKRFVLLFHIFHRLNVINCITSGIGYEK